MRPAPPPPRWGSRPARRVARCMHMHMHMHMHICTSTCTCTCTCTCMHVRACYMYPSPTRYSIEHKAVCVPPSFPLPSRPPSLPPPLYPWATLPSQLPHTSRPTPAASPSRTIYLARVLSARGKVRAPARLPLRGREHGAPLWMLRAYESPRPHTWSGM
jgi:hypothetical protein